MLSKLYLYLNGVSPGPVPGTHIPVASSNGRGGTQLTVLPVHVVSSGPRVVSQPDAKVLHTSWRRFSDLKDRKGEIFLEREFPDI